MPYRRALLLLMLALSSSPGFQRIPGREIFFVPVGEAPTAEIPAVREVVRVPRKMDQAAINRLRVKGGS